MRSGVIALRQTIPYTKPSERLAVNDSKERTPVVWLINLGGHDYTTAEKFGRLVPITEGTVNPFNPDRLMLNVSGKLKLASPDDHVLMSGQALLNALVLAMWTRRFPHINILIWSHRDKEYKPLTIPTATIERLANAA